MFRTTLMGIFLLTSLFSAFELGRQPAPTQQQDAAPAAAAQDDAKTRDELAKKLVMISVAPGMAEQMISNMVELQKSGSSGLPDEFFEAFKKRAAGDELVKLIIPIYAKHLDVETLKGLIAFYEGPIGQKFVKKQSDITTESMKAGQEWGQKVAMEIIQELQAKEKAK